MFFNNFFNGQWCRDFRLLDRPSPKGNLTTMNSIFDIDIDYVDIDSTQQKRLDRYLNQIGNVYVELSYFNDKWDLQNYNKNDRIIHHIYFDFDSSDSRLEEVKDKFKKDKHNPKIQEEFRQLLFDTNVLDKSFEEGRLVAGLLEDLSVPTFPVFSGSAGLHLHAFFPPTPASQFKNFDKAVHQWAMALIEDLGLTTFDDAVVKDPLTRIVRAPYSTNIKTGLKSLPFTWDLSKEDILNKAIDPQGFVDFNLKDYESKELLGLLLDSDQNIVEETKSYTPIKTNKYVHTDADPNVDLPFSNMKELLAFLIPERFARHYNGYDTYRCPFHEDYEASAWVNEKSFGCFGCGIKHMNYFDFIKYRFDLDSDQEVKLFMKNIRKVYNNANKHRSD